VCKKTDFWEMSMQAPLNYWDRGMTFWVFPLSPVAATAPCPRNAPGWNRLSLGGLIPPRPYAATCQPSAGFMAISPIPRTAPFSNLYVGGFQPDLAGTIAEGSHFPASARREQ